MSGDTAGQLERLEQRVDALEEHPALSVPPLRRGAGYVGTIKPEDGCIVSMLEYRGQVWIACQRAVYRVIDGKLEQFAFVPALT